MNIIVKAHHIEITNSLKEYAQKKVEKLDQYFDHIQSINVNLQINSTASINDRQEVSAIISCSGGIIKAKEVSADMYSSIDLMLDKLVVQLKKYKEKIRKHKGHSSIPSIYYANSKSKQTNKSSSIQGGERFIPKPMGAEDAAEILEDEKLSFLVFRNLKERVCVIYPTDSGEYGLIVT